MLKIHNTFFKRSSSLTHASLTMFLKPVKCKTEFNSIIDEYNIGLTNIIIGIEARTGTPLYCVDEPILSNEELNYLSIIIETLVSEGYDNIPPAKELEEICQRKGIDYELLLENYERFSYFLARGITGYGPLYPLIRDDDIEEIAVDQASKPASILHRRLGLGWIDTNIVLDQESLDAMVLYLSRRGGKSISIAHPYVEALLPEGHRLAATYGREISRHGSSIIIRKHTERPIPLPKLVSNGMLSTLMAAYLWFLIENRASILIIGPTAAGKTTLLQALLALIPSNRRVVTIEDTPELNLSFHKRWDGLITRHVYFSEQGEDIDLYKLTKFALRRRADYIVIGEVRGEEAQLLIYASTSGHGTLATFHAENAELALLRLRAPPLNIGESFLLTLWSIVVVKRVIDPVTGIEERRVTEVVEIDPNTPQIRLHKVFGWDPASYTHTPVSVDELIKKSIRLKHIADAIGADEEYLAKELSERERVIRDLVERKIYDYILFVAEMDKFYRRKLVNVSKGGIIEN